MARKNEYTPKQLAFLARGYRRMAIRDLAPAFSKKFGKTYTEGQIKAALNNHNITCGRGYGHRLTSHIRVCTPKQLEFLRKKYVKLNRQQLAAAFLKRFGVELTVKQIEWITRNHHLRSGRTGCFEKGHKSWNKGTKGLTHANPGSFKKGNVPATIKPVGHERYDPQYGYILVKVAEGKRYRTGTLYYRPKHYLVWEKKHGPVPEGHVLMFKDGNPTNCVDENLRLISRAELVRLNKYRYKTAPEELKPSIMALAKLVTITGHKKRRRENHGTGNTD